MSNLSPDDPLLLKLGSSPHEPSAVMRMHSSGWRSQAILETFRLRATQLIKQIEQGKADKDEAARLGRPIHNEIITKEKS